MSTAAAWQPVLLAVVLVVAVLVLVLLRRQRGAARLGALLPAVARREGPAPRAAVVVHAVKIDDQDVRRRQIEGLSARLGWREPLWLETTADDPGRAQAVEALDHAPDAVLAFGGDGTARMVADGLAGTGVPMGLLPAGTGNLLARNLRIPPNRLESSLRIALGGTERPIDVCYARYDDAVPGVAVAAEQAAAEQAERPGAVVDPAPEADLDRGQAFLVMAGLGFDAEIMAGANAALKSRLGWGAYVVSGMRRLRGRRTPVTISVDGGEPVRRKVRAVVVGNCGMLQAGIQLMPEAQPDDGWLDVVVLSPRSTLGWLSVSRAVLTGRPHPTVEHLRCRRVVVRAERPLQAQLDGDPAGESQFLEVTLRHQALVIRVPTPSHD